MGSICSFKLTPAAAERGDERIGRVAWDLGFRPGRAGVTHGEEEIETSTFAGAV
jgi:hypothetical protein